MRNAFAAEIEALAADDERVFLLTGDVGNRMFDKYKGRFGDRFINCGIAEANMITVAAGMAREGLRPFVYGIAPFVTYRCLEQIRLDVCYHDAPVVIVGVGAGLGYANLGPTHHSLEDIAALRALPGLDVVAPADPLEVHAATAAALAHDRGTYLRIGKKGEPALHDARPALERGRALLLREPDDLCVLSTGTTSWAAAKAVDTLRDQGARVGLVHFPWVDPLDEDLLVELSSRATTWLAAEEHVAAGGFSSAVAELVVDRQLPVTLHRAATPAPFFHEAGSPAHARDRLGLSPGRLADRLRALLGS